MDTFSLINTLHTFLELHNNYLSYYGAWLIRSVIICHNLNKCFHFKELLNTPQLIVLIKLYENTWTNFSVIALKINKVCAAERLILITMIL